MSSENTKILLVEDEPAMQALFGFSLKREGYTVLKAENGVEAIEVLKKETPDAIVCDIMMPEMDGFTFREEIIKNDEWNEIPFLFLTAFDNEENIIRGLALGAEDFIPKTDGAKVVASKLKNALRKRTEFKKKIVGELDTASKATGVLLKPPKPPEMKKYIIDHYQKNFEDVPGGDFIDYIPLDDQVLIIMGDVMGKRWKAWVFAHAYAGYIRSTVRSIASDMITDIRPAEILRRLNKAIYRDEQISESICALTIICINRENLNIKIGNALQYPLIYCDYEKNEIKQIQTDSPLLGLKLDSEFDELSFDMKPDDCLFAATDGIMEARSAAGMLEGFETLKNTLKSFKEIEKISAEKIVNAVFATSEITEAQDDATMLMVKAKQ